MQEKYQDAKRNSSHLKCEALKPYFYQETPTMTPFHHYMLTVLVAWRKSHITPHQVAAFAPYLTAKELVQYAKRQQLNFNSKQRLSNPTYKGDLTNRKMHKSSKKTYTLHFNTSNINNFKIHVNSPEMHL